jgi:hypothetical protein
VHGGQHFDVSIIGNSDRPDFLKLVAQRVELIQMARANAAAQREDAARRAAFARSPAP